MDKRRDMIEFAINRVAGFTLESSNMGDNRTIFSLVRTLLKSSQSTKLDDCRAPLLAVLNINPRNKSKFMGCKLPLLQQTIKILFGEPGKLLTDKGFKGYDRDMLLDYLEISRKIFVSEYIPTAQEKNNKETNSQDDNNVMKLAFGHARIRG